MDVELEGLNSIKAPQALPWLNFRMNVCEILVCCVAV